MLCQEGAEVLLAATFGKGRAALVLPGIPGVGAQGSTALPCATYHWSMGDGVGTWFQVNSGSRVSETLECQGFKAIEEKDA